jgi:tRNA (guanine37-N1)-methyltransferase
MRFDILTLFPEIFSGYMTQSLLNKAIEQKLVELNLWNFRDWTVDKHKHVDDRPFGGGPGMLLCCQPVYDCVEHVQQQGNEPGTLIMMTPQGRKLDQKLVEELSTHNRLVIMCGRYEGFDERIPMGLKPMEISAGDFIANGGEVPAMLVVDTVIRLIPGVLGDETSSKYESFADSDMLEYPQFTRPRVFRGMEVPEVLLSGNHEAIERWRAEQSHIRTKQRRG